MEFKDKLTDKDVAIVEVLYDYIIEEGFKVSFSDSMMIDARLLIQKLYLMVYLQEKDGI